VFLEDAAASYYASFAEGLRSSSIFLGRLLLRRIFDELSNGGVCCSSEKEFDL